MDNVTIEKTVIDLLLRVFISLVYAGSYHYNIIQVISYMIKYDILVFCHLMGVGMVITSWL